MDSLVAPRDRCKDAEKILRPRRILTDRIRKAELQGDEIALRRLLREKELLVRSQLRKAAA